MATTQETIQARASAPPAAGTSNMKWVGLGIAIALGLIILLIPTPAGLTVTGQRVLAITALTVCFWVFGTLNNGIAAILMMALMIAGGVAPPQALSGFSGGSPAFLRTRLP